MEESEGSWGPDDNHDGHQHWIESVPQACHHLSLEEQGEDKWGKVRGQWHQGKFDGGWSIVGRGETCHFVQVKWLHGHSNVYGDSHEHVNQAVDVEVWVSQPVSDGLYSMASSFANFWSSTLSFLQWDTFVGCI